MDKKITGKTLDARRIWRAGLLAAVALLLCLAWRAGVAAESERGFAVLAINDVYRIGGLEGGRRGGLARVRALRKELEAAYPDLLVLHGGDVIAPSFLGRLYRGRQMIDVLNVLDGDSDGFDSRFFAVFGNHEFDKRKLADAHILASRVRESRFTWLGSNIRFASGTDGRPLVGGANLADSRVVQSGGVRVGLFGLTTGLNHPAYIVEFADPGARARQLTALLRAQGAEFVIALTHMPLERDKAVLESLGEAGPDLIVGGHEHARLRWPEERPRIVKADADAASASVIEVTLDADGDALVTHRFMELKDSEPAPDPAVDAKVQSWLARHAVEFCAGQAPPEPPGCLDERLGRAGVALVAEEVEIRSRETNFGNWIADQALHAFRDAGAQVALVNAGSLRLNQNLGAGQAVTRRHVEELFQFATDLRLIEIDGRTLNAVASNAVEGWPGNGRWLQIAGMAFRHDPDAGSVAAVTLLTSDGPRPLRDDEKIRAVTGTYLLNPDFGDQDGYTMLNMGQIVPDADADTTLRKLVIDGLRAAGDAGIAPRIEGRICATDRPGPCLAVKS